MKAIHCTLAAAAFALATALGCSNNAPEQPTPPPTVTETPPPPSTVETGREPIAPVETRQTTPPEPGREVHEEPATSLPNTGQPGEQNK